MIYSSKFAKLPFDYKSIVKILISSVIMGIFVKIANPLGIFNILVVIAIAVIIYFAVLFILKGVDRKEIDLIKSMV